MIFIVFFFCLSSFQIYSNQSDGVIFHKVEKNDTLFSISNKYKINLDDLIKINQNILNQKKFLIPGQTLQIKNDKMKKNNTKINFLIKENHKKNSIKLMKPTDGNVINYRYFFEKSPDGIFLESKNDNVYAAENGIVIYAGNELKKTYKNIIIIKHYNSFLTIYGNIEKNLVKKNDRVIEGQIIGIAGNLVNLTKNKGIFFSLNKGHKYYDPRHFFK